jgi:putative heme-binding domain-containing protein
LVPTHFVKAWERRLAKLDWSRGDAARGRAVFTRASCAACHSGGQALGPDLSGAAGRFARADLFTAILQSGRDVSPRYRATVIETAEGKLYQGLVIYEAADGVILQTGAATTVRLAGDQIAARHGHLANARGAARRPERPRDRGPVRLPAEPGGEIGVSG